MVYYEDNIMGREHRKYSVVPYRDEWPKDFEHEAALIQSTLGGEIIYIEHVGGTAIPGLCGKPTIDIAATVRDIKKIDRFTLALKAVGYEALGEEIAQNSRLFVKNQVHEHGDVERLVNLHLFPEEHAALTAMLDNRDYLLAHPEEMRRWCGVKERLFKKHPHDYWAYREEKKDYLEQLSKKAGRWRGRYAEEKEPLI